MKKILLAMVTLSVLVFALSGCGVFTQPELGTSWDAKGGAEVNVAYPPLDGVYSLDINLEFGGIWDPNKVKTGTIKFGPAIVTDDRIDIGNPEYTVVDGTYNTSTKLLQLRCEEKGTGTTKITLRGTVSNKTTINNGLIYKTSDMTSSIGTYTVEKQ
ncbi:MAG: hypothetical protein U9N62_12510 [Thermotogota bacterium]|nr:hypothetical protein [Thermotogota bacterium]